MTDSKTSSATKLSQILKEAYKLDGKIVTSEVWKQVLKFDPECDRTIENKYLRMLQLFQYVKNDLGEIALFGTNTEKFSEAIDTILLGLFRVPLTSPWSTVMAQINVSNLNLLESCGDIIISREKGLKDISQEEMDDVLSSIISLMSEIEKSDIDSKIKKNLIGQLKKIIKSLEDYEIFGTSFFQSTVDAAFVETVIISQSIDKEKWSKEGLDKLKNVVDFFFKLTTVYSSLEKTAPQLKHLAENIIHMLPPGN
jgi:hypothetical protein